MSGPMRSSTLLAPTFLVVLLAGCSSGSTPSPAGSGDVDAGETHDASAPEAATPDAGEQAEAGPASEGGGLGGEAGAAGDAGDAGNGCSYSGAPGECISVTACAALSDHTSFAGLCPGPASIECCIVTPSTADNPPIPTGYMLMAQSQVTSAMTAWAVQILDDPAMYPMFATAMQTFGTLMVLARVEWHPPDFNNSAVHRGVTLYEPI
jgi:hypothetical protein